MAFFVRFVLAYSLFVLLPATLFGQGRFTVNGRMKVEGSDVTAARVVVYKDGKKERSITSGLSKFTLDLDINADYVLSFEKDGFVAKKVSFNTKAPAEAVANGFTPFDFAVSLFKQYDDINIVVFNQPVGIIRYDEKTGDFDYDTDYTKSIQSQLQQVLAQVAEKQKEEAEAAKANEGRSAEEARNKAKAEAEATKQAAAKAKADAEAQKMADAQAKAAEKQKLEEQKKAEAQKPEPKPKPVAEAKKPDPVPAEKPAEKPVEKKEVPRPLPPPQPPARNALASNAISGSDGRKTIAAIVREEPSRVAQAKAVAGEEQRPKEIREKYPIVMNEEVLVEPSRITKIVSVSERDRSDEYRKVTHKWGGTFYFKNGATCTQEQFEKETLNEQLAGATPRSKLD